MSVVLIKDYFPALTPYQEEAFKKLDALYRDWNSKINVVSRKDINELYTRHVLHSLGIAKVISFKDGTTILDVGTGGGFPGIPLAILFPTCNFRLVDAIGKKIKVVNEVVQALNLTNVTAHQERAENAPGKYDFVVSRAVTKMTPFYSWVEKKVANEAFNELENGILYLKGGDLTDELKEFGKPCQTFELSTYFEEEFFHTKKVVHVPFS